MRIHFVKPLRIIMLIFICVIVVNLSIYVYFGFTNRFPSIEVYLAAIFFPIIITPIVILFAVDLNVLKNDKTINNKKHNALCIVNFVLLPILTLGCIFSFTTFIYGGHGHSYTNKYSDYLIIMKSEPYKNILPYFTESEIKKFEYYENFIDSHQEDFFIVLEYDEEVKFENSLSRIKNFMPGYKSEINRLNDSYIDIVNPNGKNTYELVKINNTYEVIGEYLVVSYETKTKTIIISYWNFESDEFINEHNPFLFKYFDYIPAQQMER